MEKNKICGIYKITSPSGRVYIGQSINITERFNNYRKSLPKGQRKLYNSFVKYGFKNHSAEIIEECNLELLNIRERYWQEYYDCLKKGLNCILTSTDEIKSVVSEETKRRQSQAKIGSKHSDETKLKMSSSRSGEKNTNYGKKFSDEHKLKLSQAKIGTTRSKESIQKSKNYALSNKNTWRGRTHTAETKSKLSNIKKGNISNSTKVVIDLETGIEYLSLKIASEKLNINYHKLAYHARKGTRFKYVTIY